MFNLTEEACQKITEMTEKGYEFMLTYENSTNGTFIWEADFTRHIAGRGYDNHETGKHLTDPSRAVIEAYENHKMGKRLKLK